MEEFDFIGPNDQPALIAISTPDARQKVRDALTRMGYKVHSAETHESFEIHYNQVQYQLLVVEENFANATAQNNATLRFLQRLPMTLRRYAVFFLIGPSFESLNSMQAFTQSVHCVINLNDLAMFTDVVQKTIAENDTFMSTFREVQRRVYQKG